MQFAKGAVLLEMEATDQHHLIFIFRSQLWPLSGHHKGSNEKMPILAPIERRLSAGPAIKAGGGMIGLDWGHIHRSLCCHGNVRDLGFHRVHLRLKRNNNDHKRRHFSHDYYSAPCLVGTSKILERSAM